MMNVIALHGFLGTGRDFDPLFAEMKNRVQLEKWAPDLFAPKSPWLAGNSFHEWGEQFLEAAPSQPRYLVGYSLGGRLALQLALMAPQRWEKVFLISANPGLLSPEERQQRLQKDAAWAKRFAEDPWPDVLRSWNIQEVFNGSTEPQRYEGDFQRMLLVKALTIFSLSTMEIPPDRLARLENVHWICGEHDTKFRSLYAQLSTAGLLRNVHILPKAGHRAIFDHPAGLAELLVAR